MNKRKLGESYEEAASLYLQKKGVRIAERNFRCRQGEVDLIGWDGEYLVFFEVKYRKNKNAGYPEESVGTGKQKKYVVWRIIIFTKGDWGKAFRYGLTWLQYVGNA